MQDSTPRRNGTNFGQSVITWTDLLTCEMACQEATDKIKGELIVSLYAKGIKMELMPEKLRMIEHDQEFPTSSDAQIEAMTTKEYHVYKAMESKLATSRRRCYAIISNNLNLPPKYEETRQERIR